MEYIAETYGNDSVGAIMFQNWFVRLKIGDFELSNKEFSRNIQIDSLEELLKK